MFFNDMEEYFMKVRCREAQGMKFNELQYKIQVILRIYLLESSKAK